MVVSSIYKIKTESIVIQQSPPYKGVALVSQKQYKNSIARKNARY